MRAVIHFLTARLKYVVLAYVLIQLILIIALPLSYKSDSYYYLYLARNALESGTLYPATINLFDDYIIAPLFINIEILLLFINNSVITIALFQLSLNLLQLFILYKTVNYCFGRGTAALFVILYIFYLPNAGLVLLNMTELLFGVLLSSVLYYIIKNNIQSFLAAGILTTAAIAVRPLGWAVIPAVLIIILFYYSGERYKALLGYISGIFLLILILGGITYLNSGKFVFTSVNYGTNFLIGANDDASGAYNDKVFSEGNAGFTDDPGSMTYSEKQQFWFKQATSWISENPLEWVKIFPLKMIHIFAWDDYAVSPIMGMQEWNLYVIAKNIFIQSNYENLMTDVPVANQVFYILLQIMHHIYYFSILIFFIYVAVSKYYNGNIERTDILFIGIIGFSVIIPLLSFGDPRFKYPYILYMLALISPFLHKKFLIINPEKV